MGTEFNPNPPLGNFLSHLDQVDLSDFKVGQLDKGGVLKVINTQTLTAKRIQEVLKKQDQFLFKLTQTLENRWEVHVDPNWRGNRKIEKIEINNQTENVDVKEDLDIQALVGPYLHPAETVEETTEKESEEKSAEDEKSPEIKHTSHAKFRTSSDPITILQATQQVKTEAEHTNKRKRELDEASSEGNKRKEEDYKEAMKTKEQRDKHDEAIAAANAADRIDDLDLPPDTPDPQQHPAKRQKTQ